MKIFSHIYFLFVVLVLRCYFVNSSYEFYFGDFLAGNFSPDNLLFISLLYA
jgi:hypothetical protein